MRSRPQTAEQENADESSPTGRNRGYTGTGRKSEAGELVFSLFRMCYVLGVRKTKHAPHHDEDLDCGPVYSI